MAMIDATCPKCKKRIGWAGKMVHRPACPRCGHRPPEAELKAADDEMAEMERLVLSRSNAHLCRRQRMSAGLTMTQAADRLGLTVVQLSRYERGAEPLPEDLAVRMAELYDCGKGPYA